MILGIINQLFTSPQFIPANCHLPPLPTKAVPKAAIVPKSKGPRRLEGEAQIFVWDLGRDAGKATGSTTLTAYDVGLLKQRGFNVELAAQIKPFWSDGATASESAKQVRCSLDYAKKIHGTFKTALENEKSSAK